MHKRRVALALTAVAFTLSQSPTATAQGSLDATELQQAQRKPLTHELRSKVAALRARQTGVRDAALALQNLSEQAMPSGLPPRDRVTWPKYVLFLRGSQAQLVKAVDAWKAKLDAFEKQLERVDATADVNRLKSATQELQQITAALDLHYLQLRNNLARENRQFTMMSNIMKVKHDTAKAAINNIR